MIYLMGHWWQNWLYIELFYSCGFVSIFAPIDSIILKHDLLLDRSSQICKLIVSGQFSGPTWMSCLLTEKLLKNFQLRSLLWPASWKQKLLSAVAASDLFRSRPGSGLVWGWFSLSSPTDTGHPKSVDDDSVCTPKESWLNVRLQKKVCSALFLEWFLDEEASKQQISVFTLTVLDVQRVLHTGMWGIIAEYLLYAKCWACIHLIEP